MSKRASYLLLQDILESIDKIQRFLGAFTQAQFEADEKTVDAVVRNLEIIGEAVNRLPQPFKSQFPQIEWNKIIGLRHRIVHEYFGIDLSILWQIITRDLPQFGKLLKTIQDQ